MSRTPRGALAQVFTRSLDRLRALDTAGQGLAVAFSGGLDSSALLHLTQAYAHAAGLQLHAFHVHHGLSANADAWLAHCERSCATLSVPFAAARVQLQADGSGLEAAARKARYAALGQLCREHGVSLLLTAHHQDDQAETILLQLARGSGIAGLCGMDEMNRAPGLLGSADLQLARPLLQVARAELEDFSREQQIAFLNDESNTDTRYARNALRHTVMPALQAAFPGFAERFSRASTHARAAQNMLNELAKQDLAACLDIDALDLDKFRQLSAERANNLLRHWFAERALRMPSASWLHEMQQQLLQARADADLCVTHPDCEVHRYRGKLYLTPRHQPLAGEVDPELPVHLQAGQAFRWNGEAVLDFPAYGGRLHFEAAEEGVDGAWLRAQALEIAFRRGGESLKLAPNRPSRSLKQHFQASAIPPWERERLPLVHAGRQLLFVAGLGCDCRQISAGPDRWRLRWDTTAA